DIPTLAELGYRGNLTRVYFGLLAPAGTPKAVINKIREDVVRIGSELAFRKKLFHRSRAGADLEHAGGICPLPHRGSRHLRAGGQGGRIDAAIGESAGHATCGAHLLSAQAGGGAADAGADWLKTLRPEPPPANPAHRPSHRGRQRSSRRCATTCRPCTPRTPGRRPAADTLGRGYRSSSPPSRARRGA